MLFIDIAVFCTVISINSTGDPTAKPREKGSKIDFFLV